MEVNEYGELIDTRTGDEIVGLYSVMSAGQLMTFLVDEWQTNFSLPISVNIEFNPAL